MSSLTASLRRARRAQLALPSVLATRQLRPNSVAQNVSAVLREVRAVPLTAGVSLTSPAAQVTSSASPVLEAGRPSTFRQSSGRSAVALVSPVCASVA